MKAFVLDASMAIEWFITAGGAQRAERPHSSGAGEDDAPVSPAIMDDHAVVVPHQWRSEILNWLASSVRSDRITEMEAVHTAAEILSWPTMTGDDHGPSAILRLCREHSLTAYDATYLHLALVGGWPLATLDRDLRVAAEKLGVTLICGMHLPLRNRDSSGERIADSYAAVVATVGEILGQHVGAPEFSSGPDDGAVPVGEAVALAGGHRSVDDVQGYVLDHEA